VRSASAGTLTVDLVEKCKTAECSHERSRRSRGITYLPECGANGAKAGISLHVFPLVSRAGAAPLPIRSNLKEERRTAAERRATYRFLYDMMFCTANTRL